MINRKLNKYAGKIFNTTDPSKIQFYKQKITYYRNMQHGGDVPELMKTAEERIRAVKALHKTSGECANDLNTRETTLQDLKGKLETNEKDVIQKTDALNTASALFTDSDNKLKSEVEAEDAFLERMFKVVKQGGGALSPNQEEFLQQYKSLYEKHEGNTECAVKKNKVDLEITTTTESISEQNQLLSNIDIDISKKNKATEKNIKTLATRKESEIEFLNKILNIGQDIKRSPTPSLSVDPLAKLPVQDIPPTLFNGGCGGGTCGIPLPSFGRVH